MYQYNSNNPSRITFVQGEEKGHVGFWTALIVVLLIVGGVFADYILALL
jgi:hypothetical protein